MRYQRVGKTSEQVFSDLVGALGGIKAAADKLGITEGMVRHLMAGRRKVQRSTAELGEVLSARRFCRAALMWGSEFSRAQRGQS